MGPIWSGSVRPGLFGSIWVRLGHFDYLKEDSDDEYKKGVPAEMLKSSQFIESVTLSDKIVCEEKLMIEKQQTTYRTKNAPPVRSDLGLGYYSQAKQGSSQLSITDFQIFIGFSFRDFSF